MANPESTVKYKGDISNNLIRLTQTVNLLCHCLRLIRTVCLESTTWYPDILAPLDVLLDWCGFDSPEFKGSPSPLSSTLAITSSWLLLATTLMWIYM